MNIINMIWQVCVTKTLCSFLCPDIGRLLFSSHSYFPFRCKSSQAVVQKVVRMSMAEADLLLSRDPDVKIIHLLRDPRGSLLSRMHFSGYKGTGEMHSNHTYLCRRLMDDLKTSKNIAGKWFGELRQRW